MADLEIMAFESDDAWEVWLETNHLTASGLWLKIAKKEANIKSVTYASALEIALCFGWIDGQKTKFDDQYWLQKFTPRRPKSGWSHINREKATALIENGKMREAGLKEVERAKASGLWESAYKSPSQITVPDDFQVMLNENPTAQTFFNELSSANCYAILYRLATAKKAETRQKHLQKFIAMLNAKETIHP